MAEKNSIPQFVNSESIMSDSNYVKWLSDLKGRIRIAQLKAAIKVNEELHKLYWSLGEDICNKQKLYKWGTNFIKQLSLDLRSAFPNVEGFSWSNLYKIRKWYLFYSSQNEFLYQVGTKVETLENASVPMQRQRFICCWVGFKRHYHSIRCCKLPATRGIWANFTRNERAIRKEFH